MSNDDNVVQPGNLNRRNILLGGTTLAAVSALSAAAPVQTAQAQPTHQRRRQPPQAASRTSSSSWATTSAGLTSAPTTSGMMGYRTPNIDRIAQRRRDVHRLVRRSKSCTAGRAAFITGQSPIRTGLTKVGLPGATIGLQAEGPERRRAAEDPRLRHRAVRQEPSRRPQRVPADRARLRRILRQSLSPQCRGGAAESRLSEETRVPRANSGRAACSSARPATATIRPSIRASARSASRPSRTPARSPRSAWRRWTRNSSTAALDFIDRKQQGEQAILLLLQPDPHARLDASQAGVARARPARAVSGRHGRTRRHGRPAAQEARRPRHRQQHHRRLHHRQRRRGHDAGRMAARRRSAARRATNWEGGFRVPMLIRWPGTIKPGTVNNEIMLARRLDPDLRGGRAAIPTSCEKLRSGYSDRRQDLQGPSRRLQPASRSSRAEAKESPRKEFIYWNDDGDLSRSATSEWKVVFMEQHHEGISASGRASSPSCGYRRCSISAADPFERGDESIQYNKWMADRAFVLVPGAGRSSRSGSRASRSFRRARNPRASTSMR